MRRGFHVIPKYLGGKPLDQLSNPITRRLPFMWTAGLYERAIEKGWGKPEDYGLPKPDHRIGQAHPTVSSDILTRIGHGDITVKPNVERLEGDRVRFVDGSVEQIDRIVWCTGYKISFPFLDDELVPTRDNQVELYRRVVPPDQPGLFFIGLIQPLGAIMPIAERQSEWIADVLEGKAGLPDRERMYASIAAGRPQAQEALRRLEAAHDPGRFLRVHARARARARRRRRGPARAATDAAVA